MLAPPNVPADRVNILRRAYDAAMKDPALLAEAKKFGFEVVPQTGEAIAAKAKATMATPKDVIAEAQAMSSL